MRARRSGVVVAQAGKRLLRRGDGFTDFIAAGQRHRTALLAGRRVEHGCEPLAPSGNASAADEVLDFFWHRVRPPLFGLTGASERCR